MMSIFTRVEWQPSGMLIGFFLNLDLRVEDVYFDEDAIYMERNSRDFKRRIRIIDVNAEAACDFLNLADEVYRWRVAHGRHQGGL
jgi:cystathionine beta-lyase/cystathionine gamma-synthase